MLIVNSDGLAPIPSASRATRAMVALLSLCVAEYRGLRPPVPPGHGSRKNEFKLEKKLRKMRERAENEFESALLEYS